MNISTIKQAFSGKYRWGAVLALLMLLVYAHLAMRYAGAYPSVFADELAYSRFARLAPPELATVPSWLYFSTYRLTNACGAGFLDCARYLNLLFFIGAAPFIYGAARTVAPKPLAVLVALAAMITPANIYAAYFMPESMYYFGFAVLAWVALARSTMRWYAWAALSGAVLGLMALVKVHALFLLPGMALYTLFIVWRAAPRHKFLTGCAAVLVCAAITVAVKLVGGYLLAGPVGLGLFGNLYGEALSLGSVAPLATIIGVALANLKGHLLVLAMLFAVPLAVLLHYLASARARTDGGPAMQALVLFTVLMLGTTIALSVAYTSSMAVYVPNEGLRLHGRYYDFALVLLAMVAAARMHAFHGGRSVPALIGAALALAIVYAAVAIPSNHIILVVDYPELAGLGLPKGGRTVIAILAAQVALLGLWVLDRRYAGPLFLALVIPMIAIKAHRATREEVARTHKAGPSDAVGEVARAYLGADRGNVHIMGDSVGEMMRIQFQLDGPDVEVSPLPPGWPLEKYSLPGRKRWLLLTNDHALPAGYTTVLEHPHFKLVRTGANHRTIGSIDMRAAMPNALLRGTEGFAPADPWGQRTNAPVGKLHFNAPLPRKLSLCLTAFGRHDGEEVVIRVGTQQAQVILPVSHVEVCQPFDTDGSVRTVTLTPKEGVGVLRIDLGERR